MFSYDIITIKSHSTEQLTYERKHKIHFSLPIGGYVIKYFQYDLRFGDAFWNSSKMGMVQHIWEILTSWALVADIWYLPAMDKRVSFLSLKIAIINKSVLPAKMENVLPQQHQGYKEFKVIKR